MDKTFIEIPNGIRITEPVISKIHRKCYRATFDSEMFGGFSMQVEMDAPTMDRLNEKIEHLKKTGIILRN